MAKVYSLTTVRVVITNELKGETITIGGNGTLLGTVSYDYTDDMFSIDTSPDGGYSSNFSASKAGKVNITLKQTSSKVEELINFIQWCRSHPESAMSKITISDTLGNIACTANGVFPIKVPGNSASSAAGDRTFEFVAGEIESEERNI